MKTPCLDVFHKSKRLSHDRVEQENGHRQRALISFVAFTFDPTTCNRKKTYKPSSPDAQGQKFLSGCACSHWADTEVPETVGCCRIWRFAEIPRARTIKQQCSGSVL